MRLPQTMARRKDLSYEALRDKWYKKLADKGFEDIEHSSGNLKKYSSSVVINRSLDSIREAESYYSTARTMVHYYTFDNKLEKFIWTKHSEGLSILQIIKELKKSRRVGKTEPDSTLTTRIHKLIVKIRKEMYLYR